MTCVHTTFEASVEVNRLFPDDADEADALTTAPASVAVEVTVRCVACLKPVRFEGPIQFGIGPGSAPGVSLDGTTLLAAGHLGENRSPSIRFRFGGVS